MKRITLTLDDNGVYTVNVEGIQSGLEFLGLLEYAKHEYLTPRPEVTNHDDVPELLESDNGQA